jgi:hypothetical protein
VYPAQVAVPGLRRSGVSPGVVVLLWIFAGWPLSWILLLVFVPLGLLFGVGITVAMIVLLATSSRPAVVVTVPPPPGPLDEARREVEGLASITAVGGCGWCGSPAAHCNDGGYPVHPRHWHAAEIEEHLRITRSGWPPPLS